MGGPMNRELAQLLHPVVASLASWIHSSSSRRSHFASALEDVRSRGLSHHPELSSLSSYLILLSNFLTWKPREDADGNAIYTLLGKIYIVLDHPLVKAYQTPIVPRAISGRQSRTWLTTWMKQYCDTLGLFMDSPRSFNEETYASFLKSPRYRATDYVAPPGSWRNFNEFFARRLRPGARPIAFPHSKNVWVSPADGTFLSPRTISLDATIRTKGLEWSIAELLDDSQYSPRFAGGALVHLELRFYDYHRMHAPVKGRVLEMRLVHGTHDAQLEIVDVPRPATDEDQDEAAANCSTARTHPERQIKIQRVIQVKNEIGYQFKHTRSLTVLESEMGLVAVIAVGMTVVSSIVLTAHEQEQVDKGEELGYFQYGGSEVIVLFEHNVHIKASTGQHMLMGEAMGQWKLLPKQSSL